MKSFNKLIIYSTILFLPLLSKAQDSLKVFSLSDFYNLILTNHPVASRARTLSSSAQMELRIARGGFDPKFDADIVTKTFGGTKYYGYTDLGLKIPLWFGPDIKLGYEDNTGKNINPSDYTPEGGLAYMGIHVPIGQGMIIDERRAAFRQAQLLQNINEAERIKTINKLLLSATKDYWEWYVAYHKYQLLRKGYELASLRYEATKGRIVGGDLSAVDSIEAKITVQERYAELQNAMIDLRNDELILSNYLWTEKMEPLEMQSNLVPESYSGENTLSEEQLNELLDYASNKHPDLLKYNYKIKQLQIEKKLQMNMMLPNFDFTYKYLTKPSDPVNSENLNWDYAQNNYKIMFGVSQPLFIRKERGKFRLSQIKLQQTEFEAMMARREVLNTVKTSYNDIKLFSELVNNQEKMVQNVKILRDAENDRFQMGESSLFLLNSRENKMIDSQIKLRDLQAKMEKAKATLYYSAGNSDYAK